MKKKICLIALILTFGALAVGCSSSDEGKEVKDLNLNKYLRLGEYKGVEVQVTPSVVTQEDIDEYIQTMLLSQAEAVGVTDRKVENGDYVNVDYVGYLNDVAFEGGSAAGENILVGANKYIPGFEEGIVGATPKEELELNLTFPDTYQNTELAGQDVIFRITVNYIVPQISDEVAKAIGGDSFSNVKEMEEFAKEKIEEQGKDDDKTQALNKIISKVISETTFKELPQYLLDEQSSRIESQYSYNAQSYGMDVDTYLNIIYGSSKEDLAQQYVKERLVMQAIANKEGIAVTDEEVDESLQTAADDYGTTVESVLAGFGFTKEYYREYLLGMKVYDVLYENAVITQTE